MESDDDIERGILKLEQLLAQPRSNLFLVSYTGIFIPLAMHLYDVNWGKAPRYWSHAALHAADVIWMDLLAPEDADNGIHSSPTNARLYIYALMGCAVTKHEDTRIVGEHKKNPAHTGWEIMQQIGIAAVDRISGDALFEKCTQCPKSVFIPEVPNHYRGSHGSSRRLHARAPFEAKSSPVQGGLPSLARRRR